MNYYLIAIASGVSHEKALMFDLAMKKGKTNINHLRVTK